MAFIIEYWPKGYADADGLKRVNVETDDRAEAVKAMRSAGHPYGSIYTIRDQNPPKIDLTPEQIEGYVRAFKGDNT